VGAATMADGLTPVMTAVESAMTAETMAGVAEAAAKGPEVSIAVDGEQDVDAPTLLPETIALSGDDVANLAPPAATAAATAPAEDSEASAAPAEMTPAQASGGVGRGVGIAVAALAVIGGAVLALRSAPPAPPPSTPATAEKSSDEPQSVAAETDAAPAPVAPGVDRSALDAATAAAGLPLPEVACRAREAAEVEQLRGALAGLVGAHPQRRGDGDRAAVAALAKATSPEADAIAAWAMLAAGEGHVGVAQRAQRGLTACAGTPLALRVLGIVHMQGGRWDRAQELLAKAHALAPKDVDTAYRLGVAELGRREPKAAAAAFEAALALDPQHLDAALGLGRARLADKDAAGAIAMLQPLTARAADRGDIWFFLAAAQAASGDADAARATFCKAAKAGYAPARARCPDAAPTAPPVH
ncbi:MAG: Tetratricopeptide repeat, partial [Pseudomonadota bacterium]